MTKREWTLHTVIRPEDPEVHESLWVEDADRPIARVFAEEHARLLAAAYLLPEVREALRDLHRALGAIDDYPTASGGEHPDVQNRALDTAEALLARLDAAPEG